MDSYFCFLRAAFCSLLRAVLLPPKRSDIILNYELSLFEMLPGIGPVAACL